MDIQVRKIATLSEEEYNKVVEAGKVLGELKAGLAAGEITELSETAAALVNALKAVITAISE